MYKAAVSLVALLILTACQKTSIETYTIPKEAAPALVAPSETSQTLPFHWTLPKQWTEVPASGMRAASFKFTPSKYHAYDISIVKLSGNVGSLLANINRWRGQIKLAPLQENELNAYTQQKKIGNYSFIYVDFSNEKLSKDGRIIAAILTLENDTFFFKLTGDLNDKHAVKASFDTFLESLHHE